MRNSGFLKKIDEDSMRNTCFKNVSHNVLLWLYVLYLKSMRTWEIELKNLWFLIKFRATYLCSITLFMAILEYF